MKLIRSFSGAVTVACLCPFTFPGSANAEPRTPIAPLIPLTAPAIYSESFDEPYYAGTRDALVTVDNFTLVEGWSGYALECSGPSVAPFFVSAMDSTGHTNITCNAAGAIQFWFKPNWSSVSVTGGTGPGVNAALVELSAVSASQSVAVWSLQVSSDGTGMELLSGGNGIAPQLLLNAGISWQADQSHLITLDYSPNGTALFIDGTPVATGGGTLAIPPAVGELSVGSTLSGTGIADGDFDELHSYRRLLIQNDVTFYYNALASFADMGPVSQAQAQRFAKRRAAGLMLRASPMGAGGTFSPLAALCDCMTGGQVYLTNLVTTLNTNQSMAVTFNLAGGTNFVWYGVYSTTNLANPQWVWLTNAYTCSLVSLTNQPWPYAFYAVRPPSPTMVVAWGADGYGQCDVPSGLTNAIGVAGGFNFSLVLKSDGKVIAWGDNTYGETTVPSGLSNVVSIAAGGAFSMALQQNGTVVVWGDNTYGQTNVPASLTNATAIAAGDACCFALRQDGTVLAWGYNYYGQTNVPAFGAATQVAGGVVQGVALLTNGTVAAWANYNYSGAPYYWGVTNIPAGLSNVVSISSGAYHSLALKANGTAVAWGAGGTTPGLDNYGQALVPPGLSNIVSVGGGYLYSAALQSDGTVTAWGDDTYGELEVPGGLTGVKTMSVGGFHGLAIRYGQLTPLIYDEPNSQTVSPGGTATFSVFAVGVAGLTYQWQLNGVNIPGATNATLTLSNVQSEVAGNYQVVVSADNGSVTSDIAALNVPRPAYGLGLISGWGSNTNGELSWQTDTTNVLSLAAGKNHGLAAMDNGQVASWGSYWTGFNYVTASAPPLLTNAIAVAAGSRHDLALKADGSVIAWGINDFGQTNVPANATNIIAISADGQESLALKNDGTVFQWGQTNAPIPAGLTNVMAIAAGTNFNLALLKNSTVIAWGANNYGQTNVPLNLSNIVAIAAGGAHALALKIDGTVTAWGAWTNVPSGLSNVLNVAAGENHNIALKNNGTVICWGDNTFGETNVISGLSQVKLITGGGDFTLASEFSPLISYSLDVTKDLLLIYNTNSANSTIVFNYYLAHRPLVGGANSMGIGCSTNEIVGNVTFLNQVLTPYLNWLTNNPTKRPQYLLLFMDIPSRVEDTTTYPSVQYQLSTEAPGIQTFVSSINMNGVNGTNDCIAYINKLVSVGANYSPGKLVISASAGGYANTNYIVDDVNNGYCGDNFVFKTTNGLNAAGVSNASIQFLTGCETNNSLPHLTNAVNVAGYISWGFHSSLGGYYATDGYVRWSGNSGWWIIRTEESFNGQRAVPGGNFLPWFSSNAFGGTNYSNTPIGGPTYTEEPGAGGTDNAVFFGLWAEGNNLAICAWNANHTPYVQVVGDPFVAR
ncbi:MAG: hypothetical protein P4N60_19745 [Verrucomicrobiae bacterium]|nr:hypothetical protein [Verrucomicrobiae bacterium]